MLSVIGLTASVLAQTANAQEIKEPWRGVTVKVLIDNEHVKIAEATFAPDAVADWHSHPQHTVYAVTDAKMQVEKKDKEATTVLMKAGEAMWSPAVTHKITNIGKTPFTIVVTEIK